MSSNATLVKDRNSNAASPLKIQNTKKFQNNLQSSASKLVFNRNIKKKNKDE